jgi:putative aldouronate transport system substrate-binding protein
MKMTSKKVLTASLVLLIVSGTIFAAGGNQTGGASSGGKPTLIIGKSQSANITDYKDNYLTQYLEKRHNVNLDFYLLPLAADEQLTKIALMVSSDDLPDVLINGSLSGEAIQDYGSKGVFIKLQDYLSDPAKAPNWAATDPKVRAVMLGTITSSDGNIYSLPKFEFPGTWNLTPYRYYINTVWLDKLGLKVPTTTDELRNVLLAFRDRDPNGNGRKDEVGLWGYYDGGYGENIIAALINSFVFYNPNTLALDNTGNTVIAPFTQPGFRQALIYLNTLFKDGVLPGDIFTNNQQQFRAVLNNEPFVVGLAGMGSIGNFADNLNNPNHAQVDIMAPLAGPNGVRYTPYSPYYGQQIAYITSKSKQPDLGFKVLESFLDIETTLIGRLGEEGVNWSRKPEDLARATNIYHYMGVVKNLILVNQLGGKDIWGGNHNKHWQNDNPQYMPEEVAGAYWGSETFDPTIKSAKYNVFNDTDYAPRHPQYILPQLKYTVAETAAISEPIILVNGYVKQSVAEFIISTRDINNDAAWNAYVRELDNMGLQRWINAAQTTYNRQK